MVLLVKEKHTGKVRNARDALIADSVIKTKVNKGPWETIDELVKLWRERTPEEFQGFKVHLDNMREIQVDRKFGQTKGDKTMERRLTLIIPTSLQGMIRAVYKAHELPFDTKFFREFGRRYPFFRIPDKI